MGIEDIGKSLERLGGTPTGLNTTTAAHGKADPKKVPVDVDGNEIKVGDRVAYAVTQGRSAALRVAVVKEVGRDKYDSPVVKIEVPTQKWVYDNPKEYTGGHYVDTVRKTSVSPAGRMIIVR